MTPFRPKGLSNPILNARFPGGLEQVDGLPSGHPNLDGGHQGLLKNFPSGVLVIEMLPAPLGPEEVENEAVKNVKRLSNEGETLDLVSLDAGGGGGVVFSFEDDSPSRMNGQEGVTSHDAPHFCQTRLKASHASLA
jgi:hypothetical protein